MEAKFFVGWWLVGPRGVLGPFSSPSDARLWRRREAFFAGYRVKAGSGVTAGSYFDPAWALKFDAHQV